VPDPDHILGEKLIHASLRTWKRTGSAKEQQIIYGGGKSAGEGRRNPRVLLDVRKSPKVGVNVLKGVEARHSHRRCEGLARGGGENLKNS